MTISVRLLTFAVCAAVIFGQNPLAMAGDPFQGTFQNEQIKMELARKGGEYSGVIVLGGQSMPVKAKAVAGKLTGTFESGGQSFAFQAVRSGNQVSLTTEGVTHLLEKAGAAAPAAAPPAAAVVGEWQTPKGIVRVNADGTAVIGDKTHRWSLHGNVISFAGNGETLQVPFEMNGDTWNWKFPDGQLVLTRMKAAATAVANGIVGSWQGPSGNMQINLDGTATIGGVQYRYQQAGNQLTLAGPDGTFTAAVQQSGDSMTWLINGKTLNFQRAAATWAIGGAGGILAELVNKWCQSTYLNNSAGTYGHSTCITLLADGSFQYANDSDSTGAAGGTAGANSDSGTWTATANSITSNSKKTGTKTFRLEKRNHAKTGDPMLVIDGAEFTTAYQKAPWR
jgi:hypothetical protein